MKARSFSYGSCYVRKFFDLDSTSNLLAPPDTITKIFDNILFVGICLIYPVYCSPFYFSSKMHKLINRYLFILICVYKIMQRKLTTSEKTLNCSEQEEGFGIASRADVSPNTPIADEAGIV
jgi:hypothetical protein